jgi:PAS domain-containing protein
LFWKDPHGVYLGCNQAFAESLGLSTPADVIGNTDFELSAYSSQEAQAFQQQDRQVMAAIGPS